MKDAKDAISTDAGAATWGLEPAGSRRNDIVDGFKVGDDVVINWPSHAVRGQNGEVKRLLADGKLATAFNGGTWWFPACRLDRPP